MKSDDELTLQSDPLQEQVYLHWNSFPVNSKYNLKIPGQKDAQLCLWDSLWSPAYQTGFQLICILSPCRACNQQLKIWISARSRVRISYYHLHCHQVWGVFECCPLIHWPSYPTTIYIQTTFQVSVWRNGVHHWPIVQPSDQLNCQVYSQILVSSHEGLYSQRVWSSSRSHYSLWWKYSTSVSSEDHSHWCLCWWLVSHNIRICGTVHLAWDFHMYPLIPRANTMSARIMQYHRWIHMVLGWWCPSMKSSKCLNEMNKSLWCMSEGWKGTQHVCYQ